MIGLRLLAIAKLREAQISIPLQIFRFKAGVFGNAREHLRTDFLAVVEGKHHIRPARPRQNPMGSAALTFDDPTDVKQRGEEASRFA